MDIVERLRDEANMHDADDVDLHLEAVDEIERLRWKNAELESTSGLGRVLTKQAEEIKRLRQQNAELNQKIEDLVESLEWIANRLESNHTVPSEAILARNAIAKATGGK